MNSPIKIQKRQLVIDIPKNKIYSGDSKQIHYEQFQDTIKYFSFDKWNQFIKEVKLIKNKNRIRNILIFKLLLTTGMRISEFSKIKINQIDFTNNTIEIPFEVTKTKMRRVVRVNEELVLDLRDFIETNQIKSGYLFTNKKRNPLNVRTYQRLFEKYFIEYNLKSKLNLDFTPTPHNCRHNHIVYSLQNNIPMPIVMKNVGHKSIKTTQIYSNIAIGDVVESYKSVGF